MLFLDTDIVVDIVRKHPSAVQWANSVAGSFTIAGFTAMELIAGCRDGREQAKVDGTLSNAAIVWPDSSSCDVALENYRALHLAHGIGFIDTLIA